MTPTEINSLPELDWCDRAAVEMIEQGVDFVSQSNLVFQLGDVAVCGLIYHSMISPPWFWFALAKGVRFRDLVEFRRAATRIPDGTLTAVRYNDGTAARFAAFYGFRHTGQQVNDYLIYRMER